MRRNRGRRSRDCRRLPRRNRSRRAVRPADSPALVGGLPLVSQIFWGLHASARGLPNAEEGRQAHVFGEPFLGNRKSSRRKMSQTQDFATLLGNPAGPPAPTLTIWRLVPYSHVLAKSLIGRMRGPLRTAFAWPRSYSCFSDCDNGCTKTPTIERSDRHPPRPRLQDPTAAPLLPTVQHGRAIACDLPELRLLYGPRDRYAARVGRDGLLPR